MEELSLSDYLSVLRTRMKLCLAIFLVLFGISLVFALRWSNYRSVATIEIAQPEIMAAMTTTDGVDPVAAIESIADLQISRLQQKVFSTGALAEIITKLNLYPGLRQSVPIANIAAAMRKKIRVNLISGTLANAASASKASAGQLSAISFTLSFDYSEPLLAQQTTNELISRFIDEDTKIRRAKAKETSSFLGTQLKSLEASLLEQEKKIADFRAAHGTVRPEALAFNQQALTSTTMSLQQIEAQITTNLGTVGNLRAHLAATDPYAHMTEDGRQLMTPSQQLKALKSQQASLRSKYGAEHPDVIKIDREVETLSTLVKSRTTSTADLKTKIADIKAKLATAQATGGTENPDVISLTRQLTELQNKLERTPENETNFLSVKDADNPAYLQIAMQLQAAQDQQEALEKQREALRQQQEKYQRAIVENPATEQQLAALTRGYDNDQARYRELKAKKMAADMSQTIEADRSGQHLVVINPPEMPAGTHPARTLFILGGFIFAFMGSVIIAFAIQLLSQTLMGPRHVAQLTGAMPLVVLPYIRTQQNDDKKDAHHHLQRLRSMIAALSSSTS